jgi:exosortase A
MGITGTPICHKSTHYWPTHDRESLPIMNTPLANMPHSDQVNLLTLCAWQKYMLVAVILTPFFIYLDTAHSIVAIWNRSETFSHGYIILPISLWLIWLRRRSLSRLPVTPYWPALLILLVTGFAWLIAQFAGVHVVQQYAFVLMFPLIVIAILGKQLTWAMAFPLGFLLLAVPFGEVFIEPLINVTANFTVAALQITGIPVLREGNSFSIPSGNWSVVEACSGVRYLISSFTLGCLYAYLTYYSTKKRILFVAFSIVVPIVANGMRAYLIVMIGHLSGMQLAVGIDHLIYGWLFFGLVMFMMYWIGSYWRDPPVAVDSHANQPLHTSTVNGTVFFIIAMLSIICSGIWPAYAYWTDYGTSLRATPPFDQLAHAWQNAARPVHLNWHPGFSGATKEMDTSYLLNGEPVYLSLRYYDGESHNGELISSTNRMVDEHDKTWQQLSTTERNLVLSDRRLAVRETLLRQTHGYLLVWHWYWVGDQFTANDYYGKFLQAKEKLLSHRKDGTAIFVYATFLDSPDEARTKMQQFVEQHVTTLQTLVAASG